MKTPLMYYKSLDERCRRQAIARINSERKAARRCPVVGFCRDDGDPDDVVSHSLFPATSLSDLVKSMHDGGLPLHAVGEANFDEDDAGFDADPGANFGHDRFELHDMQSRRAMRNVARNVGSVAPAPAPAPADAAPAPPAPAAPAAASAASSGE